MKSRIKSISFKGKFDYNKLWKRILIVCQFFVGLIGASVFGAMLMISLATEGDVALIILREMPVAFIMFLGFVASMITLVPILKKANL